MYEVRVFHDIDDQFLKAEWERLEREADVFPQSTYHWCATWWKHLSGGRRLHVVMVRDGRDRTLAVAPLCTEGTPLGRIIRSFPVNFGDFFEIITPPDTDRSLVFQAVFSYLLRYDNWYGVLLAPVNDHSRFFDFLRMQGVFTRRLVGNIIADISASSWPGYLKTLSRERRRFTRRKMQDLQSAHRVEVEIIRSERGFLEQFDRIREMQALRSRRDRPARSKRYMACAKEVYGGLFRRNQMLLFLLKADDRVVAYRLGFVKERTFYDWNTNYDVDWSNYSPGLISIAYLIRCLIEEGFTSLDFMAGVYDYKISYAPKHQMRYNHRVVLGKRSISGKLFRSYELEWRERIRPYYRGAICGISKLRGLLSRQPSTP